MSTCYREKQHDAWSEALKAKSSWQVHHLCSQAPVWPKPGTG